MVSFLKDDGNSRIFLLSISRNTTMLKRVSKKGIIFPVHSTDARHPENKIQIVKGKIKIGMSGFFAKWVFKLTQGGKNNLLVCKLNKKR